MKKATVPTILSDHDVNNFAQRAVVAARRAARGGWHLLVSEIRRGLIAVEVIRLAECYPGIPAAGIVVIATAAYKLANVEDV